MKVGGFGGGVFRGRRACHLFGRRHGVTLAHLPRELEGVSRIEWLIVDDGSADGTSLVAAQHGAQRHKNRFVFGMLGNSSGHSLGLLLHLPQLAQQNRKIATMQTGERIRRQHGWA